MAALLRALHLGWGLPSLLEEAMPLRVALGMIDPATGAVSLNPRFFNYPSLSVYLHLLGAAAVYGVGSLFGAWHSWADFLLLFDLDPTPVLVVARLIHAGADLSTVWAVYRIARRFSAPAAWIAMLLTALSPVLLRTQQTLIVDTLAAALLAWSFERLADWQARGMPRSLHAAAVLLGLAASTKYPAAVMVVPLLAAILLRRPARPARLALAALGLALVAFLCTSPFLLLDPGAALRDLAFERQHLATGHLGSLGRTSLLFHLGNLAVTLGPLGILALVLSPALCRGPAVRPLALPLMLGVVLLVAPIVVVRYDAERYLAPALPLAAVLAAAAAAAAGSLVRPPRAPAWAGRLAAAGLVVPVAVAGLGVALGGADDTRRVAREWCERHLEPEALIVQEAWSVPLVSVAKKDEVTAGAAYRHAGPGSRARFDATPGHRVVTLPLRVTGALDAPAAAGGPASIAAVDLNRAYYQPALFAAADYVVTSGAVRGRYQADSVRHAAQARFYRLLDARAEPVAVFSPTSRVSGPEIRIYRITPGCRAELAREPLDPFWWTAGMPEGIGRGPARSTAEAEWRVRVYAGYFRRFATELAYASLWRGDTLGAETLTRISTAVDLDDAESALLYSVCRGARGDWRDAAAALERALARGPEDAALLMLQLARVEGRLGRAERQRAHLLEVRRREPPGSPLDRAAAAELLLLPPG